MSASKTYFLLYYSLLNKLKSKDYLLLSKDSNKYSIGPSSVNNFKKLAIRFILLSPTVLD